MKDPLHEVIVRRYNADLDNARSRLIISLGNAVCALNSLQRLRNLPLSAMGDHLREAQDALCDMADAYDELQKIKETSDDTDK